ncbi:hypothetical protein CERSUDRAFT_110907 [Gelatoporia subvermispora B]|uniref:UBA domain-containing protein n=1 Tax=Ceriporiopsis subvermispora (strain B) TaxID=914234 RepID=M2R786_CERS8|nr:hypothetical protein CERSUDRAFT_110907 [Gelatoporia subvermispora B]
MSDSFADLWNSTAPTKQPAPPRKLGALTPSTPASQQPRNDVFSMLAAAGTSSATTSRSISPAGPVKPTSNATPARPSPAPASSGSGDVFSSLLSGTLVSSSNANGANLTIAQRAARAEQERKQQLQGQGTATRQQPSAWDGLDALGGFSGGAQASSLSSPSPSTASHTEDTAWNFGLQVTQPAKTSSPAPPVEDDWGLEDFAPPPASTKASAPVSQNASLFSLDDFASAPAAPAVQSPHIRVSRSSTPGDFDFGDREDGLLANASDDEDDILGDLAKPVTQSQRQPSNHERATPARLHTSGPQSRAVSPPPHIIGQIVEMGFSPQQARVALAATESGLDVEAALEYLLSNGAGGPSSGTDQAPRTERPVPGVNGGRESGWERYYESDEEAAPAPAPRRRQGPPGGEGAARPDSQQRSAAAAGVDAQRLQEQADKLIAQASEIGLSMFNRANAFWKEGKEKVQKAYEERASTSRAGGSKPTQNGRPRWMQDAADDEGRAEGREGQPSLADEDNVLPPHPSTQAQRPAKNPQRAEEPAPSKESRVRTGNLFSDDPPAVYVSPFRRKAPSRGPTNIEPAPAPKAPSPRLSSPIQLIQRKTVSASPSALAASAKHKTAGTERFKLGQYAEADTLYSSAIIALPESHLLLVPLYNNRALARIRTGDFSGAIEDCTAVISLIGPSYNPAREAKVTKEEDGAGVDLGDGLVKALRRRAEAYEGKEKWDAARQDWEAIAAAEWAGKLRGEAVRGVGRCRRMLQADPETGAATQTSQPPRPAAPARPKPAPASRESQSESAALNRVREANQAAEAEDLAKHELKDTVEAKLTAWKSGKETNIRALIASLDTVLWPELGWQKVGMHELVTPSQVKIRYTKAIAKLHPDKLNVNNTTLEQRMIANGVFGSLSEAWNAFKQ